MEDTTKEVPAQDPPVNHDKSGWQILWFLLHLVTVYTIVQFFTPWLAGWTRGRLLPLLQHPAASSSFEFLYSHIFVFSFIPAFLLGLAASRSRHRAAGFVWVPPAVILAFKFVSFPASSVFASQFHAAFHQYFEGRFLIPEVRNWQDLRVMASSADVPRALAQFEFTAPFYAGIAYSIAATIGRKAELAQMISHKLENWEDSRFGEKPDHADEQPLNPAQ